MHYYAQLLNAYQMKGLLIDSNLLLLFFVGACNRARITTFDRTAMFATADFDLLVAIIRRFEKVVTTPNILTEVSNLLGQIRGEARDFYVQFSNGIASLDEQYRSSRSLVSQSFFPKFGLTDTGIIEEARDKYLVLTVDWALCGYLQKAGIDVINFNHIRAVNLF